MQLKTFGKISEIIDKEISIDFPVTLRDFKIKICKEFPLLATNTYIIAINEGIITEDNFMINEHDTIALLPPFSGG